MSWPEIAGDPRFFQRSGPISLAAIRDAAQGIITHQDEGGRWLQGVAPLQIATSEQVSFLDNRRYATALAASRAGVILVHPDMANRVPAGSIAVVTTEPYLAWARVCTLFHPAPPVHPGIHPSAVLGVNVRIHPSAEIGPFVVIGSGAEIGERCRVGAGSVLGPGVVLGDDCRVGAHVTLSHALVGHRVVIHTGARIGQEGFGFAIAKDGFHSVPQLGRVILEDDVDIGANTTVDRGSARDTVIGAGSRLDNLVQIGHNVRIGRACVIVAQVGVSGSTVIEDQVMLGGQVGVAGHVRIGRGAKVGGQAGVMSDIAAGAEMVGSPAQPAREFFRQIALFRRMLRKIESGRSAGASTHHVSDADSG
jgi:UDP-3-O-[3-hydroxymyristoyl] glucosamine N-acyltransferase